MDGGGEGHGGVAGQFDTQGGCAVRSEVLDQRGGQGGWVLGRGRGGGFPFLLGVVGVDAAPHDLQFAIMLQDDAHPGAGEVLGGVGDGVPLGIGAPVAVRTKTLVEEELTLRDLRQALTLTREHVAKSTGMKPESVLRIERRADLLLSMLSSYVAAMGGRLRLVAEFPDRGPVAVTLGEITGEVMGEPAGDRARE